ncbi:MAG: DUF5668 domain-containing protein [Bacteroidales bacterium]
MNYKNIFWGLILVVLGVLLFLKNLDVLYFSWRDLWQLWPLLLILWGLSILPVKSVWKLILSALAIIITLWMVGGDSWHWNDRYSCDRDEYSHMEEGDAHWSDQFVTEPYDPAVRFVDLNLEAAAGTFRIKNSTEDLFSFDHKGNIGPYAMKISGTEERKSITLGLENSVSGIARVRNTTEMMLHTDPVWTIDIDAGAAKIDLDLSPYKIKALELEGGAASIDITFGEAFDDTEVTIDAGATALTLRIPESVACEVRSESFLTSRNFRGFEKIERGLYRTGNFHDDGKKMKVTLESAISSVSIVRY